MNIAILYSLMFLLTSTSTLLIGYGALLFALGFWSRRWPAIPGVVESSTLVAGQNGHGLRAYWVKAKYTYHWGVSRRGSWIGFAYPGTASNSKFTRAKAEALHATLAPGTQVNVYVCPRLPALAVLRPGYNLAAFGYIALSQLFAAVPLWLLWLYRQG